MLISEVQCKELAQEIANLLLQQNILLATAESCTGGWLAKCCTDCVGSSQWFDCSVVSYSYSSKNQILNIDNDLLEKHGAVDPIIVAEMAKNLLLISKATVSIAISGIAGPREETNDNQKPVGMVCFAWAKKEGFCKTETMYFKGTREEVRLQSVYHALLGIKYLISSPSTSLRNQMDT
jgi:nicotinamide-nucleotide amidase